MKRKMIESPKITIRRGNDFWMELYTDSVTLMSLIDDVNRDAIHIRYGEIDIIRSSIEELMESTHPMETIITIGKRRAKTIITMKNWVYTP